MAMYGPFCFFLLTIASLVCEQTTAIDIKITPEVFDKIRSNAVEVSCEQKDHLTTIQEILALEIVKDGKPVVIIRRNSKVRFIGGNDTRLNAVGQVVKDASKSYLSLTIMTPSSKDSGQYTCVIDYIDEVGIIKTERDSKNLTAQKLDIPSIGDLLGYLNQKIESLEKSCKEQINKTDVKLMDKISTLEGTSNGQDLAIKGLTEKVDYRTAFSVSNDRTAMYNNPGNVLILSDVLLQVGNGYNRWNGIFTSPRKGLYVFHLVVYDDTSQCLLRMEIHAAGSIVARLETYGKDQSSISSVVQLSAGEAVYAKMINGNCVVHNHMFTTFSGYLIKAF